ncbi:GMC oxidoreductase-domain-containing protein [Cyathus striatus]|nr:GMC oxidoreductase-domain-containing protein [Cyathus striatus]
MHLGDESFDIIFAGGGTTACVTAGRLAEADPSLKILIIEIGQHTKERQEHIQPGRCVRNLTTNKELFAFYQANPSTALAGRSVIVSSGKCLGGGSSVNFTNYTRAASSDYDDWENLYGNKGWSSKHLIPLLKNAETYQSEVHNSTHGTSGPIKVSQSNATIDIAKQFLHVAELYDKERILVNDINDFTTCNGYGRWARYIDINSGRRSDAAHGYIYSLEGKKHNIHILTQARVIRVLFEGIRAIGVEYIEEVENTENGVASVSIARASKMVLISAGAFGSSSILERSGIGAKHILEKNGIPQVVDLPGVGEHYMDHNVVLSPFFAVEHVDTMDIIYHGKEEELKPYVEEWARTGGGLMAQSGIDAGIKIRPIEKDLDDLGPEFRKRWNTHFAYAPDKPLLQIAPFTAYVGPHSEVPHRKCFTMEYIADYPLSTGHVHITTGLDPHGKLDFRSGFFDNPLDIAVLRWAYKKGREFARRMPSYRGEYGLGHPEFVNGSQAICQEADGPVSIDTPNILYTTEDDQAIDLFLRQTGNYKILTAHKKDTDLRCVVETTWHSMGTCAMKAREQDGVVDNRLNVYGVSCLKVVDCSIIPSNVGANTYNTAIAIGEKAALLVAEELHLY